MEKSEAFMALLLIGSCVMFAVLAQAFDPANVKLCQKWNSDEIVVVSVNFPCPPGYSIIGMPSMPKGKI